MKTKFVLLFVLIGLTACRAEGPPLPPIKVVCAQTDTPTASEPTHSGGQPGRMSVSGAIVKDDLIIDSRIVTEAAVGFGQGPINLEVEDENLPFLSTDWNSYFQSMDIHAQKTTFRSIGCDGPRAAEYAQTHGLNLVEPQKASDSLVVISANTIMICGKIDQLSLGSLDFVSDRLILDHVQLVHEGRNSSHHLSFNTNKLELLGESTITAKGMDSDRPSIEWSPNFGFHVRSQISADSAGKVKLISLGSSQAKP